jgi:hypothetical protein
MPWCDLETLAPHTKAVWETASAAHPAPVLEGVPAFLGVQSRPDRSDWARALNRTAPFGRISNREAMLRWLLTRAVVDQGSDVDGVEMWHEGFLERCYAAGFPILHAPSVLLDEYPEVLRIADEVRDEVVAARKDIWAAQAPRRHAGNYTPFNVDGSWGGTQAHWFVSARFFSGLMTCHAVNGGLTEIVFGHAARETPSAMARRLRNDRRVGLGYTAGDKASDLFAKWAVGSYRLADGLPVTWCPTDVPIPMDQRIGRLMIRCGFMDEFFGAVRLMAVAAHGFKPKDGQPRPHAMSSDLPPGRWHLTVMDFRRYSRVADNRLVAWLDAEWERLAAPPRDGPWYPQDVVAALCRSATDAGVNLTPVELDDFFMRCGDAACWDSDPECGTCSLTTACQANTDPSRARLKNCYT